MEKPATNAVVAERPRAPAVTETFSSPPPTQLAVGGPPAPAKSEGWPWLYLLLALLAMVIAVIVARVLVQQRSGQGKAL